MKNLHFTTVLGVRRARSDERVVSRRDLPNLPCGKEKKKFYEILQRSSIFEEQRSQQLFSADFLSSLSQQLFSAALLSSFSQQPFSAALLSSLSQQLFSAAFLSSLSQQLFSAALLSRFSQQPFSAALLSSSSQQLFSAAFLSSSSQQLFSAAFLSSSSQQLFSAAFPQQLFSAALLSYHLAVVRGWWSASNIILLWSRVGGQVCYRSLEGPFRNAFGNNLIFKLKGLDVSKSREGRDSPDPVEMGKPNLGKLENVTKQKFQWRMTEICDREFGLNISFWPKKTLTRCQANVVSGFFQDSQAGSKVQLGVLT